MVDQVMEWLPAIKEKEGVKTWLEWVGSVRTVTEGKVCVARITRSILMTDESNCRSSSKHLEHGSLLHWLFITKL